MDRYRYFRGGLLTGCERTRRRSARGERAGNRPPGNGAGRLSQNWRTTRPAWLCRTNHRYLGVDESRSRAHLLQHSLRSVAPITGITSGTAAEWLDSAGFMRILGRQAHRDGAEALASLRYDCKLCTAAIF